LAFTELFPDYFRENTPVWIPFDGTKFPNNVVEGGREDNQKLYIGRSHHMGSMTPGKVSADQPNCVIPWGTISNEKEDFEMLVSSGETNWVAARDGRVPQNALQAGHSEQGETLFIGRVFHNGSMIVGKVQPSHRGCYIPVDDKELHSRVYEVLVV
jgi:Protein of unknown function (DUF3421)